MRRRFWTWTNRVGLAVGWIASIVVFGVAREFNASEWLKALEVAISMFAAVGTVGAVVVALDLAGRSDSLEDRRSTVAARMAAVRLLPPLQAIEDQASTVARELNYTDIPHVGRHRGMRDRMLRGELFGESVLNLEDADVAATEWLVPNLAQDLSQALMAFRLLRAEIVEFDEHKFGDRGPISGEDMLRWERESKEGAELISRSVKALLDLTPRRVR